MWRPAVLVLLAAALIAGCTDDDDARIETATVDAGEVVQTVAAPARLEPAARATVAATASGQVAELLVDDGDVVAAGDPLVRLTSATLDEQVEQAEAAVEAARGAADAARDAGVDLSPAIGALRGQVDGVFPPLLAALESQVTAAESALEGAIGAVVATTQATDELQAALVAALDDDDVLDAVDALDLDLDELPVGADTSGALATLEQARVATADARGQLAATRRAIDDTSAELATAEAELAGQADAATEAQTAAVEAQVEQAERALSALEDRTEGLLVTAPIGGVVELVRGRGDAGASAGPLGELGGLDGLEGLDGLDTGVLGGDDGAEVTGPIVVGREVRVGQPLVRIFDLSSFHADVEVDEIDVVEVAAGQQVELIVDAYPGLELSGRVDHVALAPTRGVTGGALYPVTVELTDPPDDIQLRTGLTASAEIEVRRVDGELVVPTSALLRRGGGEVVYVVRDGVVHETPVAVQAIGDENAAIDGQLEQGEQVVTIGVELVQDGDELP